MALVPLMAASQGLDELFSQMAPNTQPTEPSIWPLAIGYWLILAALLVLIAGAVFSFIKQRPWRAIKNELALIQALPQAQQLVRLHQLLRWLSIHHARQPKELSPKAFADWVNQHNNGQTPDWLNAHYQADAEAVRLDWAGIKVLVRHIYKEGKV
ncbi:MAG: DUF4381 family protein [Reinekea sp.]|jgi:hypothetical protein